MCVYMCMCVHVCSVHAYICSCVYMNMFMCACGCMYVWLCHIIWLQEDLAYTYRLKLKKLVHSQAGNMLLIQHLGGRGRHWSTQQVLNHLALHSKTFSLKMKERDQGREEEKEKRNQASKQASREKKKPGVQRINTVSCFSVVLRKHLETAIFKETSLF